MSTDVDHCRHCGLLTSDMSPCCEQWERDQAAIPLTLDEAESMLRVWFGPGRPRDLAQLLMSEYDRLRKVEVAARAYVAADPGDIELGEKVWNDLVAVAGPSS